MDDVGAAARGSNAVFFGSVRGAYTGSQGDRHGFQEEAAGGTLFLNHLGELPAMLQPMLLRFLDTGEFGGWARRPCVTPTRG